MWNKLNMTTINMCQGWLVQKMETNTHTHTQKQWPYHGII